MKLGFSLFMAVLILGACGGSGDPTGSPNDPDSTPGAAPASEADNPIDVPQEVVVLGDSTGNAIDEWPAVWGSTLTDSRRVQTRQWDFESQRFAPEWSNLGGEGQLLRIWNLSQPNAGTDYPLQDERWAAIKTQTPGLVILNYGHNEPVEQVVSNTAELVEAAQTRWPEAEIVVTLQNPVTTVAENQQALRVDLLRDWAETNDIRVVDAWGAFEDEGRIPRLLIDGAHPSQAGTRVWAGAVTSLFTE